MRMPLPYCKLPVASLMALALLFSLSNDAHAEKKSEASPQSLSLVQEKLAKLKQALNQSQEARKDAADALKDSEVAISVANKKLYEINQKQQAHKAMLAKLAAESLATNQALTSQQKQLSTQLYQQYLHGRQSYVQMVLQNDHPGAMARDVHYFSYIAKVRAKLINKMQGNLNHLNQLNEETTSTLEKVAELKQKQIDERQVLQSQKQVKSKIVRSLSQQIAMQRGEIKKLSRDEKRLSQLVERLARATPPGGKKQKNKRTAPADSSNSNKAAQEAPPTLANNVEPSFEGHSGNFSSLRGKLRLPVRGEVSNQFGSSRADSGISWKGLFIKANEGSEVKSVASGQVVFADWLRGFGNLIILDHGDGYMSLYGNNQAVLKQVGDSVKAGDAIASVGNSGGNEANGLYYELRRQSRPFDPLSWSLVN
ncbi:COG4942 Membrane-bound metallopeptidase [Methylophilaceae bacterium]